MHHLTLHQEPMMRDSTHHLTLNTPEINKTNKYTEHYLLSK